jgi:uncharacterized delta-60 repeat protein
LRAGATFPSPANKESFIMWTTFVSLCLALSGRAAQWPAPRRRPAFHRPSHRPRLEALEGRCLLSAGALDPTFGNGAGYVTTSPTTGADLARAALIQTDGKILAAGTVYVTKGSSSTEEFGVARYLAQDTVINGVTYHTGNLDPTFGTGGTALATFSGGADLKAAALAPDGKIVLSGATIISTKTSTQWVLAVARFNPYGTLDATFGNKGEVTTSFSVNTNSVNTNGKGSVVVQPDGKIVVAEGTNGGGLALARYNSNGTLDTTFGSGGKLLTPLAQQSDADALLLQPDGKLIVSGDTDPDYPYWKNSYWVLARYNPDGSLDSTFGTGGIVSGPFEGGGASGSGAALYPSGTANAGKIIVVGDVSGGGGMARYKPDGNLDTTFGTGGEVITSTNGPSSIAIAADGKLVVAANSNSAQAVFRFNADGSVDSTFGTGGIVTTAIGAGDSYATSVALQSNGDIVTVGYATNSTKSLFTVARYLPSEPEIGSFTANPNPVTSGSSVTLTASAITDANPNSTVRQVAFYYYDGNGNQVTLGTVTTGSGGAWTLNYTVTLAPGTYTVYAQAEDSYNVLGDPIGLPLQVQ